MFQYTDLREELAEYLSQEQVEQITQAYLVAAQAHQNQKRFSGEPYITHPVEVARILARMHLDHHSIMAALLHDTIEDTALDKNKIQEQFGDKVAELVDGVSKLTNIHFDSKEEAQAENFRKMMLAMAQDIRVIIIKLADRLHNMRTLGPLPPAKRQRISLETLEIYAPIAHRLGMNNFKVEFEDLSFMYLYPLRYRVLKESVRQSRGNRKALVSTVEKTIKESLLQAGIEHCTVRGREKYLYSVYKKMRKKRGSLSDILDIYAFRIIVDEVSDCYRVLGLIHNIYRPVSGRFKDYIAIPKANGYQSLHTSLHGPFGGPIEVQIRTNSMETIAENGIAAHWSYKEKGSEVIEDPVAHLRTGEWLQGLLDIQENTGDSLEFIKTVKIDLYPEAVYVFTPTGKILSLPQGATPVDFAYLVHTDIGNHCISCKINQRLAPLNTRLESGQIVEIITAPNAQPNPAWLSFALTGKTRSNIRHWLKTQQRSESRDLGKRLINTVLTSYGQMDGVLDQLAPEKRKQILVDLKIDNIESLYEEIGLGKRLSPLVAQVILQVLEKHSDYLESEGPLYIKGTEGLIVSYANCCYPIPGDLIVGHLVEGQGLTIHTEQCVKVSQFRRHPLHCINVQWAENIQGAFQVPLEIEVVNERGVLAVLASTFTEMNADIVNVSVDERDGIHNLVKFIVLVQDRAHLAKIMRRFRLIQAVTKITREKSVS